jgi:hypothetical protein
MCTAAGEKLKYRPDVPAGIYMKATCNQVKNVAMWTVVTSQHFGGVRNLEAQPEVEILKMHKKCHAA